MRIYNTLSKTKEVFTPLTEKKVNLFVCGPTVYDYPHLGHAKTYTQFDFIVKYLRYLGYDVFYLQNITDIDDKVINRARDQNTSWQELTQLFTQIYLADMAALHNTAVTHYAPATSYIPQIVDQVKTLMKRGFAYSTSDGIYFEISKFLDYGKLSGRTTLKEDDSVTRIDTGAEKRGWNDFCLWKYSKPDEPFWETELGKGRPGWHIEDTAITQHFFGPQYDIHGGAVDLIIPHHEAEIAQMESASGKKPLVKYWLHTAFLNINAKKMSKSLKNFLTIRDVLQTYTYQTLRYAFISQHYRTTLDFSDDLLTQAQSALTRFEEFCRKLNPTVDSESEQKLVADLKLEVDTYLQDDFDTPKALATLFDFIKTHNSKKTVLGKPTLMYFAELNQVFEFFSLPDTDQNLPANIQALIAQRETYRKTKEFAKADELRNQLLQFGITLYDTPDGVTWKKT